MLGDDLLDQPEGILGGLVGLGQENEEDRVAEMVEQLRPEIVGHFDLIRKFDGAGASFGADTWKHIEGALEAIRAVPDTIAVSAGEPIARVADLMRSKRIHRVLVIEDGTLRGLVSSLDIVGVVADRG